MMYLYLYVSVLSSMDCLLSCPLSLEWIVQCGTCSHEHVAHFLNIPVTSGVTDLSERTDGLQAEYELAAFRNDRILWRSKVGYLIIPCLPEASFMRDRKATAEWLASQASIHKDASSIHGGSKINK